MDFFSDKENANISNIQLSVQLDLSVFLNRPLINGPLINESLFCTESLDFLDLNINEGNESKNPSGNQNEGPSGNPSPNSFNLFIKPKTLYKNN